MGILGKVGKKKVCESQFEKKTVYHRKGLTEAWGTETAMFSISKYLFWGCFLSFFPYQINNNCTTQLLPICIPLGPIYITSQLWDASLHRVIPSTATHRDDNRRSVWSHWGPHGSPNTHCCCLATTLRDTALEMVPFFHASHRRVFLLSLSLFFWYYWMCGWLGLHVVHFSSVRLSSGAIGGLNTPPRVSAV